MPQVTRELGSARMRRMLADLPDTRILYDRLAEFVHTQHQCAKTPPIDYELPLKRVINAIT